MNLLSKLLSHPQNSCSRKTLLNPHLQFEVLAVACEIVSDWNVFSGTNTEQEGRRKEGLNI